MIRAYLVPVEAGGRGPEYFAYRGKPVAPSVSTQLFESHGYGAEPSILIIGDVNDVDDAFLAAQPDVTKFADNWDDQLGANLAAMQNALEALNIPGTLLIATNTYRQVLRGILGIFDIANCMQGKGYNIFAAGITLNTTMGQLPMAPRAALNDCMVFYQYDVSAITLATTVRQVLRGISQQARATLAMGIQV